MPSTNFNDLKICPLQIELISGDIVFNTRKIIDGVSKIDADVFITPELALNGGCADKILDITAYQQQITQAIAEICDATKKVVIIGCLYKTSQGYKSSVLWLEDGEIKHVFAKPKQVHAVSYQDQTISLVIGNDNDILSVLAADHRVDLDKTDLIIMMNSSALSLYDSSISADKHLLPEIAMLNNVRLIKVNSVGADEHNVFSGASCAYNEYGKMVYQAPYVLETPFFYTGAQGILEQEQLYFIDWQHKPLSYQYRFDDYSYTLSILYNALVIATRAYVEKYNFKGVVLGLSGGVDSALTLAIAVDALGKDNVTAVMLPYLYTSEASIADATEQANNLGVKFEVVPIEPVMQAFQSTLAPLFADFPADVTEENLQARTRAVILMAMANKKGLLLLNTGNKSELATGYCTLYGDMAGGFAPLKDVLKTQVFSLAQYYNFVSKKSVIPERVITRAPSAELAPNQCDQDILPPYAELDKILHYILNGGAVEEARLTAQGLDVDVTYKILNMITTSKFKREQAAVGPIFSNHMLDDF